MKTKFLGLVALISFLSNLIWESLQPSLFKGYQGFWQHFGQCVFATIGDMIYITALYLFFAFLYKDIFWIARLTFGKSLILILSGAFSAVVFEKIAVSWGLWDYGNMPLIPFLEVGLFPVLQFAVLPSFSYILSWKILKGFGEVSEL